jgi:hypothetical protein
VKYFSQAESPVEPVAPLGQTGLPLRNEKKYNSLNSETPSNLKCIPLIKLFYFSLADSCQLSGCSEIVKK